MNKILASKGTLRLGYSVRVNFYKLHVLTYNNLPVK